jgi:hypothetical protein
VGGISGSEFRHVFDDVFDVNTASEPTAAAAAAAGRGADQEFLDYILKVRLTLFVSFSYCSHFSCIVSLSEGCCWGLWRCPQHAACADASSTT